MSKEKSLFSKLPVEMQSVVKAFLPTWAALKTEMNEVPPIVVEPVKLGETTLQDGTVVKYTGETLDVGSELTLVTPEGETPAPEGDLMLADGTTVTVTIQDGKAVVSAVVPAEAPAEEAMEAKDIKDVKERVTKIVEKFEAQENTINDLKAQIESLKLKVGKQGALLTQNTDMLIAFSEVETDEPIEKPSDMVGSKKTKGINKFLNKIKK